MKSIIGDIRDLEKFKGAIIAQRPEIVVHMAAQSLVGYSYDNPVETYATNVMGTVNLLEAVRRTESVRVVVCVTSDKCYQNNEWLWGYRENEPMGGYDPYSSSKGCAELAISAYRSSFFPAENYERHQVAVASARAGNVIGGGDWARGRLVVDIMNAFAANDPVIIRSPNAIRPWQHVLEPLSGYLCLAEQLWMHGPEFSEGWNFGPRDEDAAPVSSILEYLANLWGEGARWELDSQEHPHEALSLRLDCSKARALLPWSPRLDLETALEWVVEWYRGYEQNEAMRQLTEAQIVRYENMESACSSKKQS